MPCDVSYMYPTHKELNASRVFTLLDEVEGGKFNRHHWSGYHPKAYNQGVSDPDLDAAVATLCSCLQSLDVSRLSLEMQMWWRDHLVADRNKSRAVPEGRDHRSRTPRGYRQADPT